MKKITLNFRMVAACIVATLTLGFTNEILAGNNGEVPTDIKFLGTQNGQQIFQLSLETSANSEYTFTIRDGDRVLLFSEKLIGENISRKYKLDADNISWVDGITFEVTNTLTKETLVYKISNFRKVAENTVITKL
ncbi:MAG: hypothetical protein ABI863_17395 [Ginsengibacter sp.]